MESGPQFSEIDQPTPSGMTYNRAPQSRMKRKAIGNPYFPSDMHPKNVFRSYQLGER